MKTKTIRINSNQLTNPFLKRNIYRTVETCNKVRGIWMYIGKIYYKEDTTFGLHKITSSNADDLHQKMKEQMKELIIKVP